MSLLYILFKKLFNCFIVSLLELKERKFGMFKVLTNKLDYAIIYIEIKDSYLKYFSIKCSGGHNEKVNITCIFIFVYFLINHGTGNNKIIHRCFIHR